MVIRAPHGRRSSQVKTVESRKGPFGASVAALMWITSLVVPLIALATPLISFANYPLQPFPFFVGILCWAIGLWLFHRSHADLGTNWSISLEIRQEHQLVTRGVYHLWVLKTPPACQLLNSRFFGC